MELESKKWSNSGGSIFALLFIDSHSHTEIDRVSSSAIRWAAPMTAFVMTTNRLSGPDQWIHRIKNPWPARDHHCLGLKDLRYFLYSFILWSLFCIETGAMKRHHSAQTAATMWSPRSLCENRFMFTHCLSAKCP